MALSHEDQNSGERTVVKDCFHLIDNRLDLLTKSGVKHMMDKPYDSFPDSTVV